LSSQSKSGEEIQEIALHVQDGAAGCFVFWVELKNSGFCLFLGLDCIQVVRHQNYPPTENKKKA